MDERARRGLRPPQDEPTIVRPRAGARALPPGTIVGHTYLIEAALARDSIGETYRARHVELGTTHAVKIILPTLAADPKAMQPVIDEARKLGRVRHDAIVNYQGLFRDEQGLRYLVTEFVEGESLRAILARRRLEPDEVMRLRDRLAGGLAEVHARGIIHRYISPDSIILSDGEVERAKLVDFGLTRSPDPGEVTVIGGRAVNNDAYLSPEQFGLFGGRVDSRSDIYSLGLVLAAAAIGFGRTLDMGASPTAALAARQRVPDLSAVPARLRPVIAPMLEPRPDDRPVSMRALLDEGSTRPAAWRAMRPWRLVAGGAAGLALLALIGAAALAFWRLAAAPPAPAALRAQLTAATAGYACASLDYSLAADRAVRVSGHVATDADRARLRRAIGEISGLGPVGFEVTVMGRPHCAVAALFAPLTSRSPRAPVIAFAAKATPHIGDRLALDVRAPGFDAYIYVDYFERGGQVLHLFPNDRDILNIRPARNHFVLFKPPLKSCWALSGHTGRELISLVATTRPLFADLPRQIENAHDYLGRLSAALAKARPGERAAALLFFDLRGPVPGSAPAPACQSGS